MAVPASKITPLDVGLLLIRSIVGVVGVFHGSQKIFGAFEGPGMKGFAGFLETLNVPMPGVSAWLAALAEFGGGAMLILGILPRIAAVPFAITMAVAIITVHPGAFSAGKNGMEFPLTLGVVALGIAFTGGGRLALFPEHKVFPRKAG
ncbi:MAG: DoxX family protein [Phycisphaerales bacterium]|nr:DoxX family protein [Phycisphaerales bacterium]